MNNEFNNENMNQIQNNNMNNQYANNYNNLNNQNINNEVENINTNNQLNNRNNNKLKKVLLSIIVIIVLGIVALTIYVVLDKKENNIDNNKDNVQEENNDNSNVDNNVNDIPEKDYAKLEQKVLDEYYLKTIDIINEHILEYRYSAIVNNEVTYEEFYKAYTTKNIMNSLKPVSGCNVNSNNQDVEYDKNGVKYPMYCTEDTLFLDCVEEYAKELGLTVEEISKIDKSVWPELPGGGGGGYCNNVYNAKEIKEKYLDIYNNIFKTSFKIYLSNELNGPTNGYIYDKNIDKIMNDGYGGTPIFNERVIINSNEENNLYKVRFVEGTFSPSEGGKWIESSINEEISKNDENEATELIKRNKDKLPNYEITFEKTSTGYKYKSIRKVENKVENTTAKEINLKNIECRQEDNECTKVFDMNYNGIDHKIKIVQSYEGESGGVPYSYKKSIKFYIDNKLIETIENISSGTKDTNFDGYAYTFDSKYLGILYPSSAGDYVLNIYNNDIKIGEQEIIWGIQGLYKDKEQKIKLNTLENVEFDGNKLLYWPRHAYGSSYKMCSLTIQNNKINIEYIDYLEEVYSNGGATW